MSEDVGESKFNSITDIDIRAKTIAKDLLKHYQFRTTMDTNRFFWMYDSVNKIWRVNGKERLLGILVALGYDALKESTENAIIHYIEKKTFIEQKDFITRDGLIAFENCTLDAKNNYEVIADDPKHYIKNRFPVKYNPKATCPTFLKTLNASIPEVEDRINFLECQAIPFVPHINFEKAVMFIGKPASGKSTMFRLMKDVFGNENTVSLSMQDLCENRFAAERLVNRKLNLYADMSDKKIKDLSRFKMIVSGDQITVEPKGKQSYEIIPEVKHYFSTNNLPEMSEDNYAVWRRFQIVEFPISFAENKDLELYDKLIAEKEGIVNLWIKTARNISRNGCLTYEQSLEDVRMRWLMESNAVHEMIEKSGLVKKTTDGKISRKRFFELYIKYCTSKKYTKRSARGVAMQVQTLGYESLKSSSERYWLGLEEVVKKEGQTEL